MVENWISSSKSMSNIFGRSSLKSKDGKMETCENIVNLGDFSSIGNDCLSNSNIVDKGKGSLLRLFQSDVFDAHLHLYYMYHHKEYGVHEYLVNLLYEKSDDVLWYLPQLCEISMNRYEHSSLWKFFLDKSSENMNFSLILSWMYQAISEDNIPVISLHAQNMLQEIEMAVVNSKLKPDMRYIEKRLFNWRKSKIRLFQSNVMNITGDEDYENNSGNSSYLNRENTHTQLSLALYTALPSSETINIDDDEKNDHIVNINEDYDEDNKTINASIPLSSCDILPDIWIYRIINDEFNNDCNYRFEYIKNRLDIINRQFKHLYSSLSSAAHYNPYPNNNNTSSSGFGSLNHGFSVNIIGSSLNVNGINNFNKVSIPYFFFTKLGSPFDLIDVNKIIGDIQLRCKSRISNFSNNLNLKNDKEENSDFSKEVDKVISKEVIEYSDDNKDINYEDNNCDFDLPIQFKRYIVNNEEIFKVYISEIEKESETLYYLLKQHRCNYFNRINQLVSQMLEISNFLQTHINKEHRNEILEFIIEELNLWLFYSRFSISIMRTTFLLNSISLPMLSFNNLHYKDKNYKFKFDDDNLLNLSHSSFIGEKRLNSLNNCQFLRIISNECKVFNSRKRVHFLLAIEIADLDDNDEFTSNTQELISMDILNYLRNHGIKLKNDNYDFNDKNNKSQDILMKFLNILSVGISDSNDENLIKDDLDEVTFIEKSPFNNDEKLNNDDNNIDISNEDDYDNDDWPQETWSSKVLRYKKESPYSKLKSWDIKTILLKSSDDLRQELLASQLLQQFDWIFKINNLPLWLHPYEILVIGSHGGFIEYIQDTFSIDSLKRRFQTDNLLYCFNQLFKSNELKTKARKCFVESHAAYSLVSYFLQVKDRHNGNFLIDKYGHIIQIDYGFMLSNSPGNVNFEQSPFKLTQEFLDVMLGENSHEFQYFQQLIIKGFLASRKYVDQIVLTIEAMTSASKLPCFSLFTNKDYFIQEIKDRFFLHLTEEQCVTKITELIQVSINNWRSIQYDAFQRITNGIL